jgi:hypothetical protein
MFTLTFVLWLLMLVFIVAHLIPAPTSATHPRAAGWAKLGIWLILALLSIVLVLTHTLVLR